MDRYADSMIARGPTLTADRATATGSMWEFEGDEVANARFLVIGHGKSDTSAVGSARSAAQRRYFADGGYLEQVIACGPLLSGDGREWVGDAMLIELRDRAAVDAMLASTPLARAGLYARVEVHDWEFGGRR